jgi:hypothetical protein
MNPSTRVKADLTLSLTKPQLFGLLAGGAWTGSSMPAIPRR